MTDNDLKGTQTRSTMAEKQPEVPHQAKKTYICETCGRDAPVEQVWPCVVCTKSYCVQHLEFTLHNCYGSQKQAHE